MPTTYRIVPAHGPAVTLATRADLDAWIARAGLEVTGAMPARSPGVMAVAYRPWIVGQPKIRGVAGPMADYEGVARCVASLFHPTASDPLDGQPVTGWDEVRAYALARGYLRWYRPGEIAP